MSDSTTKVCRKCGQAKALDDFTIDTRYADGRYPWCAVCRRAWRQGRKERIRELNAAWRERNPDRTREHGRNHYARNKDKIAPKRREYDRQRWHNDAEYRVRKRNQDRERYQNNPQANARKRAAVLRYYYAVRHTPKYRHMRNRRDRINKQRRRARLAAVESTLTMQEWQAILKEQNHRCAACQRHFNIFLRPTLDHIVPVSKGGGTTKENTQALCASCNSRKRTKIIDYRPLKQTSFLDGDDE